MRISQATEGFILQKSIAGLSPRTLELYQHQLDHLASTSAIRPSNKSPLLT
jgi:hypothetical protein